MRGGNGYEPMTNESSPAGAIIRDMKDLSKRVRTIELPDAAQLGNLVKQVQAALVNLSTQVNTLVGQALGNYFTKTQTDARIASTPGSVTVNGDQTVTGQQSVTGPMFNTHGRNNPVTASYVNAYFNGDARIAVSPSSVRFKQDFSAVDPGPIVEALRRVAMVHFKYSAAVDEYGDDAPVELGGIPEYFVEAGLEDWVVQDDQGVPWAINYERMTIPLILAFQSLDARLSAVEGASSR